MELKNALFKKDTIFQYVPQDPAANIIHNVVWLETKNKPLQYFWFVEKWYWSVYDFF